MTKKWDKTKECMNLYCQIKQYVDILALKDAEGKTMGFFLSRVEGAIASELDLEQLGELLEDLKSCETRLKHQLLGIDSLESLKAKLTEVLKGFDKLYNVAKQCSSKIGRCSTKEFDAQLEAIQKKIDSAMSECPADFNYGQAVALCESLKLNDDLDIFIAGMPEADWGDISKYDLWAHEDLDFAEYDVNVFRVLAIRDDMYERFLSHFFDSDSDSDSDSDYKSSAAHAIYKARAEAEAGAGAGAEP